MRKSNSIVGYLQDTGVKKQDIRFFDCKGINTPSRPWRDSVAAYVAAVARMRPNQVESLAARAANIIHIDRTADEEYVTRDEIVSPSGKVEIYFGMVISLAGAPFWAIRKDGIMLGSTYVKEVATSANANGVITAVRHLMKNVEIVRPDGARMFSPAESIRDDELRQIWAYYHKNKRMPEHGCMIPLLLGAEDILAICDVFGLQPFTEDDKLCVKIVNTSAGSEHVVKEKTIYHIFVDLTIRREEV